MYNQLPICTSHSIVGRGEGTILLFFSCQDTSMVLVRDTSTLSTISVQDTSPVPIQDASVLTTSYSG